MAVYEAVRDHGYTAYTDSDSSDRVLGIRWVKVHSQTLGAARPVRARNDDDGLGPASRRLVPFSDLGGHSGLLITGEAPLWLLAEDTASPRLVDCAFKPLYGFTTLAAESGPLSGIFSLGEEVYMAELPENMRFSSEIPFTKVIEDRLYTGVAYHGHSNSYVAIATYDAPFEIFTDEGEPIHRDTDPTRQEPTGTRSTLELIEPGSWKTIDG
jgi:cleavage and polyadenylation specificity factor subunit 1